MQVNQLKGKLDWLQFKKFASFGTTKGAQQLHPIFFSSRPPFVQLRLSQILKASYFTVADWRKAFPSVLTSWCKSITSVPFREVVCAVIHKEQRALTELTSNLKLKIKFALGINSVTSVATVAEKENTNKASAFSQNNRHLQKIQIM